MDHRIAKDMISSGMIPSGEKKQDDLSRTQYGTVPSPDALSDVYKKMYEHHKKDADGNTIPHEGEDLNEGKIPAGLQAYLDKKKGKKEDKKDMKEEVDKFDVVFNHFISEGYSEKEAYAKMANLTEEQLDEFLKALAQAGMRGAQSVGRATKGIATAAAQQGQNLSKVRPAVANRMLGKPQAPKPRVSPGQTSLDLKGAGMQDRTAPKSPSEVVEKDSAFQARKRMSNAIRVAGTMKERQRQRDNMKEEKLDEGIGLAAKAALGLVKKIVKKPIVRKIGQDMATGAAMQAGSSLMSGGGGGSNQNQNKTKNVSSTPPPQTQYASADLFDIVKGQLLDEGLSEEEIRDIMLTLTPDEILKEIEESSMSAGSSGGHYSDGGDGVFRSKEQVGRQFNKNFPPAKNGKVDKSTRKAINTSARDFGIQGPTTLKQSVEPEGETI